MRSLFQASLQTSFTWVWNTSLAVAILIALVLLVTLVFQKVLPPRWRYALWLLVVLRMLLPGAPPSRLSIFNAWEGWSFHSQPQPPATTPAEVAPVIAQPQAPDFAADAGTAEQSGALPRNDASGGSLAWQAEAAFVWLLGAAGYLLVVFFQHRKLSSWLMTQKPVESERVACLVGQGRATLGLSRTVPVIESNASRAPSVFGVFRPRILLSKSMLQDLSDQELRLVILHELVHVQRRDVSLNWLLILLQALYWFNPFVWLAMRRLRSERELVCDAEVMRHLDPDERHAYGATLIKMLDSFSTPSFAPSLVPILSHKHEIHRRITMIAQFKPTARLATLGSAFLLLALGCLTFTTAAEKSLVLPPEAAKGDADLAKQRDSAQHRLKILEEELSRRDDEVKRMQQVVDKLKTDLQISDHEDTGQASRGQAANELDPLRRLEVLRVEAQAAFIEIDTLYSHLANLDRLKLKKALLTVVPDPVLAERLNQQSLNEQELAKLLETFGTDHPDVRRARRLAETIQKQIDDRVEGILLGLKAKRDSQKARLEALQAEVDKAKNSDTEISPARRPYYQAKRDLENMQFIREKLMMRLIQEKVDAAIPK